MKLVFVNRYFHPDISATSQLLSDLAFHLARQGRQVHVVTSRQRYGDAAANLPAIEELEGLTIHRVWTSWFGRAWLPGRAVDYFSFYVFAAFCIARLARRGDLVIAMTDPPLVSFPAALAAGWRGARLVNWLQDVFPEVAERLGLGAVRGPAGALVRWARGYSLRAATLSVVLGDRMRETVARLEPRCSERIAVIHNWADGEALRPQRRAGPLRAQWEPGDPRASGNPGVVAQVATRPSREWQPGRRAQRQRGRPHPLAGHARAGSSPTTPRSASPRVAAECAVADRRRGATRC